LWPAHDVADERDKHRGGGRGGMDFLSPTA
jgi:hypothetical protein